MKPWQVGLVSAGAVIGAVIFFGKKKKHLQQVRDPWRLHFQVADDRRAQVVLSTLEEYGISTELEHFDGTSLFVRWLPDDWYVEGETEPVERIFRALDGAPGIEFIEAEEQRGKGETEVLNSGDPGSPSLADPDLSDFRWMMDYHAQRGK